MQLTKEQYGQEELLQPFEDYLRGQGAALFAPEVTITVARAPARIDCMGGIADYSGSVVFEGPLRRAAIVAYQPRDDMLLRVRSVSLDENDEPREAEFHLPSFRNDDGAMKSYEEIAAIFESDRDSAWAANILGSLLVLEREGLQRFEHGGNFLLWRDLPLGAGVGSSAAMQVAALFAVASGTGLDVPGVRLAALGQTLENRVVGAPCGIMDQVASALGEPGKLLAIRCQPCEVLGQHDLPEGVKVFGINSSVHHSVAGTAYANARISAFMGLRIILAEKETRGQTITEADGYLCNLDPETYLDEFRSLIPEQMSGAAFLERYGGTTDTVTRVDPDTTYPVRAGTDHPVFENRRVEMFIECIDRACTGDQTALIEGGQQMHASFWSYGLNCRLGCEETDLLARLVRERGPERGLYGVRISGGGSGGTVAILARADAAEDIYEIAADYEERTGLKPDVFDGTSPGLYAFGARRYRFEGGQTGG